MSEPAWTPGPWSRGYADENDQRYVGAENGRLVCVCAHEGVGGLIPEMEANARLIAAAPELYAVAETVLQIWEAGTKGHKPFPAASLRAALAKARGEELPP